MKLNPSKLDDDDELDVGVVKPNPSELDDDDELDVEAANPNPSELDDDDNVIFAKPNPSELDDDDELDVEATKPNPSELDDDEVCSGNENEVAGAGATDENPNEGIKLNADVCWDIGTSLTSVFARFRWSVLSSSFGRFAITVDDD
ncbi:MAG: hypothetical protein KGL39_01110 [Patescibacteria group bacterium]|nr:hypothetical protein [Patescibacteria group bacterium]